MFIVQMHSGSKKRKSICISLNFCFYWYVETASTSEVGWRKLLEKGKKKIFRNFLVKFDSRQIKEQSAVPLSRQGKRSTASLSKKTGSILRHFRKNKKSFPKKNIYTLSKSPFIQHQFERGSITILNISKHAHTF